MNRELYDKWCERGILGLVLAILVYGPLATGAVRLQDLSVIEWLAAGVLLLWIVRLWLNPAPKLLWPPICWAVLAFALYAIARYLFADIEYIGRLELTRVLLYAFLFVAILNNLHRQEYTRIMALTLVFLGMAISGYAIYQFATNTNMVWWYINPYEHRGSGTYINPNHFAGFVELVVPLALAWTLVGRVKPVLRILIGYAGFVMLAGIAVSVSRAGWVAAGIALTLLFAVLLFQRGYRLPAALVVVIILAAAAFIAPQSRLFRQRVKQLTEHGQFHDSARLDLWQPAVQLWREDPWWGIGPGHFNYRFRAHRPQRVQREPDRAHNDYLNTLTDWGIVGFVLVGSAWVLLAAGIRKTWPVLLGAPNDFASRRSSKFALLLGASAGLLAILIHSVADFNMQIPANAITTITLMALVSSLLRFATERHWFSAGAAARAVLTLVLAAGAAFLAWQGTRMARQQTWLARAAQAPVDSAPRLEALEKAFAIEPMNYLTAYNIGETYRARSWRGEGDNEELAVQAMRWYEQARRLNPYHGYSYLRQGMCLDWLERWPESRSYYDRAVELDPNGYFTSANVGWHYMQSSDYAAARVWFERSLRLQRTNNAIAETYLQFINRRYFEAWTNDISPQGDLVPVRTETLGSK